MELFSLAAIIIYAIFLGITMKIADLLDEHGLKWFPGDRLLFGLFWGFFGILLILSRADIANILFARILAYIPRKSLNYLNHAIAAVMIIIAFAWKTSSSNIFNPVIFLVFLVTFIIFGSLRDYFGKKNNQSLFFYINEFAIYNIIAALIYSIIVKDYTAFLVFTAMQLSYNAIKYGFYFKGWTKEL